MFYKFYPWFLWNKYLINILIANTDIDWLQTSVVEGSLVPKSLYLTEAELEKEGHHITDDSIYHSISLSKGQVSRSAHYTKKALDVLRFKVHYTSTPRQFLGMLSDCISCYHK